jgi:glycosyltransferase involved in cell wall biosynthesis
MNETITILLATYNGEKYLSHQLDSILNQSYTNWHLMIRDDLSKDNTPAIIEKYRKAYPDKIEVIDNCGKNKGSLLNFAALLQAAGNAKYIMFCDQDDEWKRDKIEVTFLKMRELEKEHGLNCPIMIFTNFQYVDENMQIIPSKKDFEINRIKDFGFPHLLAQNPVYGCTSMINRSLADKVGSIPPEADFHDHWIALIAAAFGKLCYLKEKTVLYRQHSSNVSGNHDNDSWKKRFKRILVNRKNFAEVKAKYTMLLTFKKKYYKDLHPAYRNMLDTFLSIFDKKNPFIFIKNIQNGVRSQTLAQSLLLYATILFTKTPSRL